MRLIDADALFSEIENDYKNANGMRRRGLSEALDSIADAPTIDAVPVRRCQYCCYFAEAKFNEKGFLICPASGMEITGMDFCSYGERKDGDG